MGIKQYDKLRETRHFTAPYSVYSLTPNELKAALKKVSPKSQQQHVNMDLSLQKHWPRIQRKRSNSDEKEMPNIQTAPMFRYGTITPLYNMLK